MRFSRWNVKFGGLALLGLVLAPGSSPSWAAGFAIFEQGANGMGFGGAFVAQSDPSSIFHNAAGIAFLKGQHIYFGATVIHPNVDFTGDNPFPGSSTVEKGDAGIIVPPSFDYTHQISERLVVGLGVHLPYGLRSRWKDRETTFTGRFLSKEAELLSFSINPTVAYKLADRLAVGVGLDVRLAKIKLQRNVPSINPFTQKVIDVAAVDLESDFNRGIGFNVGLLAKPSDSLSIGVAYRHNVKVDFTGEAAFRLIPTGNVGFDGLVAANLPSEPAPLTTRIDFPSFTAVGFAYDWADWTLAADVNFHNWSSFDALELNFEGRPDLSSVIEEEYKNSRIYRVGIERRLSDRWAVRFGYYFDESPSPTESVSPLLPDADRHGLAGGFTFRNGNFRVDVASWYVISKDRSTEGVNREDYNGTYESTAELFAVSFGYEF